MRFVSHGREIYISQSSPFVRKKDNEFCTIAMKNHQVDIVIIDEMPAFEIAKAHNDTKIINIALTDEKYAIGIAPHNEALKDSINAILEEMKQDGTLQSIIAAYYTQK